MAAISNSTRREKILLMAFPAALVLAIYSIFVAIPQQREFRKALDHRDAVQKASIPQSVAEDTRQSLELTRMAFQELKERVADDREHLKTLSVAWRNNDTRLATVQEISDMLRQRNMTIVSQSEEVRPLLSEYTQGVLDVMDEQDPDEPLHYWQIELEGRYFDLQDFLSAIDLERMMIMPISISMEASTSNNGLHKWKIIFVV